MCVGRSTVHAQEENVAAHGSMFALARCVSTIGVARLRKSGHGSSKTSPVNTNSCSRPVAGDIVGGLFARAGISGLCLSSWCADYKSEHPALCSFQRHEHAFHKCPGGARIHHFPRGGGAKES